MTAPVPPSQGIRRSRTGAVLGGVCAGVARSAGLDPLLLRVAVVAVTLLTGGGAALAYLAAWVLVPREQPVPGATLPPSSDRPGVPRPDVPGAVGSTHDETGPAVRAAWTAAGHDLRSLAAELRHPASDPGPTTPPARAPGPTPTAPTPAAPTTTAPTPTAGTPDGSTAPDVTAPVAATDPDADPDAAIEPDAQTEPAAAMSAPSDGSIPSPRSPLTAADDAATALGERLRAPEVQAGARKAAASVTEALNASVDELGRRIRRDPG